MDSGTLDLGKATYNGEDTEEELVVEKPIVYVTSSYWNYSRR